MVTAVIDNADPGSESMTLFLPRELRLQLMRMAEDRQSTEAALVEKAIRRVLRAEQSPGLPRYARRLGPMVD